MSSLASQTRQSFEVGAIVRHVQQVATGLTGVVVKRPSGYEQDTHSVWVQWGDGAVQGLPPHLLVLVRA